MPNELRIPGSEMHRLHSDAVGDDFEIAVFPPALPVPGPLPVVYCTDGNIYYGIAANVLNLLQGGAEIPPVRLVCIGYPLAPNASGMNEFIRLRTRDFAPAADPALQAAQARMGVAGAEGGGAEAFLRFLTTELRPWIDDRYGATDDATLIGDSLGGLFATYTLFHQPSAFRRYVIGSPWLCWNRDISTGYEAAYAASHSDLDATVFLAAGADEGVLPPAMPPPLVDFLRLADTAQLTRALGDGLERRHYPSLRLTTRIFPNETHFTIPPILIAHGLRAVFAADRHAAA